MGHWTMATEWSYLHWSFSDRYSQAPYVNVIAECRINSTLAISVDCYHFFWLQIHKLPFITNVRLKKLDAVTNRTTIYAIVKVNTHTI